MDVYPTDLELTADGLLIKWSDGQCRRYTLVELRENCPCANCREKKRGTAAKPKDLLPVLTIEETQPLSIAGMKPVGSYAYTIAFSDGHDTGIYTFEHLRELGREVTGDIT